MKGKIAAFCNRFAGVAIYGAGNNGNALYNLLKRLKYTVNSFLVSNMKNNSSKIDGIPVFTLAQWMERPREDLGILIAVSEYYKEEVLDNLSCYSAINYLYVDRSAYLELFRQVYPVSADRFINSSKPLSRGFGLRRGQSICRYYINQFLTMESRKIGAVSKTLEVGDDYLYSRKFFQSAETHDLLIYPRMDLSNPHTLKQNFYDVFVCTQVFNVIYELREAIDGAFSLLVPGGVMLATVAGVVSPISRPDYECHGYYWGFSSMGIRRIIGDVFGMDNVRTVSYGNAMAATAYVQGMALEDVGNRGLLDEKDEDYAIVIGITARKSGDC